MDDSEAQGEAGVNSSWGSRGILMVSLLFPLDEEEEEEVLDSSANWRAALWRWSEECGEERAWRG